MATARMTLFKPIFIDQRIALTPSEFTEAAPDIDSYLVAKIRKDLEGQCCTHGYVRPGSTQILARSMGQGEHGRFTGDFLYTCKVKIMCLLPVADQIVEARILKMNKLGGYALIVDEGRLREAMRILLPRDLHLGNTTFDGLAEGKGVRVRLMRSRFQAKDAFINSIGVFEGMAPSADVDAAPPSEEITLQPAVPDTEPAAVAGKKKKQTEPKAPAPETKASRNTAAALQAAIDSGITAAPAAAPETKASRNTAAALQAAIDSMAAPVAEQPPAAEPPPEAQQPPAAASQPPPAAAAAAPSPPASALPAPAAATQQPPAPSFLSAVTNIFNSVQASAEEGGLAPKTA